LFARHIDALAVCIGASVDFQQAFIRPSLCRLVLIAISWDQKDRVLEICFTLYLLDTCGFRHFEGVFADLPVIEINIKIPFGNPVLSIRCGSGGYEGKSKKAN
jgi:hypothetical protein